jgi:hypothetical protein
MFIINGLKSVRTAFARYRLTFPFRRYGTAPVVKPDKRLGSDKK